LKRHITPWRVIGLVIRLFVVTVVILFSIPSGDYILLPDVAHPVAPLVQVHGSGSTKPGSGTLYFVDVFSRRANELEALFPWIRPHGSLLPAREIIPPCASASEAEAAQLREMAQSQRVAAAVALRRLGYHVVVKPTGVAVAQLYENTNAPCNLQPTDVIISANGIPTLTVAALHSVLGRLKPGDVVTLRVRRGGKTVTVPIRTVPTPGDPTRPLVGIATEQAATIKLPIRVAIDTHDIGGPSAGLAFALEVMQKLGRNVLHGHKVAATGEIGLNGAVGPIGGIKQKTYGVRQAGADVFLVPVGDNNAKDARRYAGPVRIIPVRTFSQALRALATLPRGQ
jgi:PDZ domain-containing protein